MSRSPSPPISSPLLSSPPVHPCPQHAKDHTNATPPSAQTGYEIQRRYLARKYQDAQTAQQLWSTAQLASSTYEPGTQITDHFEVVEKTPTAITVRCGDSPLRRPGSRDADGLFVIGARVDKQAGEVELALKGAFFTSARQVAGAHGPMPDWMAALHIWYSRIWMASGSRRLLK